MRFRKLGHTGFDVSVVSFGTWQLGGKRWNGLSEDDSIKLLHQARDIGINLFDVAVVYGQYQDEQDYLQSQSQELLGKAFKNNRDKVFYCLKLGQFDEYSHRADFDPKRLVEQFKHSLRRLQTNYADICLIHAPSLAAVKDGKAISILQTLQALDLVKAVGYSFENEPEHVLEAVKQDIDVIMLQYNLIDTECINVFEEAMNHGVGILVGGPFKRGYLTGEYKKIEELPSDDYWQWNLNHNKDKVKEILYKVGQLLSEYKSPKELRKAALQFILKQNGVASAVIGHRAIQEVKENIALVEIGELIANEIQ